MRNQKYLTLLKRFELSKNETVMGKPKYSGENHLTLLKRFELSILRSLQMESLDHFWLIQKALW